MHATKTTKEKETPTDATPRQEAMARFFLEDRRTIFLWGQVDDASARHITERLLYLNSLDGAADITLWINSPGGLNTAGFAILDAMRLISADVRTICTGLAASFGALILICGAPGKRFVLPNARVMIHQPWLPGEYRATATELSIQADEILKQRRAIDEVIAEATGRSPEEIAADTERDHWLDAPAAVAYGAVDAVLERL